MRFRKEGSFEGLGTTGITNQTIAGSNDHYNGGGNLRHRNACSGGAPTNKVLAREAETNLPSLTAIHSRDELDKRMRDITNAKD
jgi:hypothetical protein